MNTAQDTAKGRDNIGIVGGAILKDGAKLKGLWFIDKWAFPAKIRRKAEAEFRAGLLLKDALAKFGQYYKGRVFAGENLLLNEGINAIWTLVAGGSETAYNNANARLCVGDETVAAAATQTDLQAVRNKTVWAASTAYSLGAFRRKTAAPVDGDLFYFEVTTAGTSAASEPTWPTTDGGTVVDGGVTWTARQRKTYKAMDATYPTSGTAQKITFRSTYGGTEANYAWQEYSADNGSTPVKNLNRLVSNQGTKTSGQSWQLTLEITLS